MAKKNIHPQLNEVNVKFPDGSSIIIHSTYNKSDTIFAEVLIDKHPAWMGKLADSSESINKKVQSFMSKFGDRFGETSDKKK